MDETAEHWAALKLKSSSWVDIGSEAGWELVQVLEWQIEHNECMETWPCLDRQICGEF